MQLFFVEGNIGTGKSTFLGMIEKHFGDRAQVIYEPVDVWTSFIDESTGQNILHYFYSDQIKYAYTFQNIALLSRLERLKSIDTTKEFVFIERSIWSDKRVFAENCHESGFMNNIEFKLYNSWFKWIEESVESLVKDKKFIYLVSSVQTCDDRIHIRNRPEEHSISKEYLFLLEKKHESWLKEVPDCIRLDSRVNFTEDFQFLQMVKSIIQ
jgi:deoxyadenosine/deoxycytidine kinase